MAKSLGKILKGESSTTSIRAGKGKNYGRVVDIILDSTHPRYQEKGSLKSLNGVFYENLSRTGSEDQNSDPRFAYSNNANIVRVPVIGEVITIESQPTQSDQGFGINTKQYYTGIVNYWNSPNTNTYLDTRKTSLLDISQGNTFEESPKVSPIKPRPGDIYMVGRQGQSLRFTGSKVNSSQIVNNTNIGKPLTILSNGQIETEDGYTPIEENINEDGSSIYLTSDHKIDLKQASEKQDTFNNPYVKVENFKGEQVILTGGRVVLNSSKEDLLMFSKKKIALSSNESTGIDSGEEIGLDAKKIYLGKSARTSNGSNRQPVLLGNRTEEFLESILSSLDSITTAMSTSATIDGKAIPILNKEGTKLKAILGILKNRINPRGTSSLKSKKVFVE